MNPTIEAALNEVMKALLMLGFFVGLGWLLWPRKKSRFPAVADGPPDEPYRVYTFEHDMALPARDVPAALEAKSLDRIKGWASHDPAIWRRKIAAARALADHIDSAGDAAARIKSAFAGDGSGWAIGLLIDQSGSMKDDPILHVAASAKWLSNHLGELGASVTLYGFSTVGWQGGRVRQDWLRNGQPARPGRLCALLHIVYQPFGEPLADEDWDVMLHPDVLRENVDGEAIEWAAGQLRGQLQPNKLLIVVSDGAPVDDATLQYNDPSYLMRHIRTVIADCEAAPDIILGAVGVGYRVDAWYGNAISTSDLADLPDALATLITRIVSNSPTDRP
jgi:cobaltochelatase CobT